MAKRKLSVLWVDTTDEYTALHIKFSRALTPLEVDGLARRIEQGLAK